MRLLLVTHYYPAHGGGVEKVAAELARRLAEPPRGWQLTWLASDCDPPPGELAATVNCIPLHAWNGIERRSGIPWPLWSPGALCRLWREVAEADAVHLHDALYFGNACAWLFARLKGVPVIVTQHVGAIPFRSRLPRVIHALANRTLGRLVLGGSQRVVFVSPAVRDEFSRFCRFRAPPCHIPNGVDTAIFNADGAATDDPAIGAARRCGRRVLLFVGRFVEKKGLPLLRELAAAFPADLWVFAGHGPLDPAAWRLDNVIVVRGRSGIDLAPYYRAADLLVLPSVGEGFPLVVQEAMACGTPVMIGAQTAAGCPDATPLMFVVDVGAGGAAPWLRRWSELRASPQGLHDLRPRVAAFAREHWSWQRAADAYAELMPALPVTAAT